MGSRIPLAEMIQSLREELQAGVAEGEDELLACHVSGLELELDVAIERENQTEGAVRFYVVEANAGEDDERETHTMLLKLACAPPAAEDA